MTSERPCSRALWDQTPTAVRDYIHALEGRVTAFEAIVQCLEATVQHVTERVQQDSRTSSRPPSSDPPQALAKRPRRVPSGRRPGGQPGHEGHTRALVPVEAVDLVRPVKPERCRRCPHPLLGEDPAPSTIWCYSLPSLRADGGNRPTTRRCVQLSTVTISPQLAPALPRGLHPMAAMGTNQLDAPLRQSLPQWVRVTGLVVEHTRRLLARPTGAVARDGHGVQGRFQ